jgi:hypothetical protein
LILGGRYGYQIENEKSITNSEYLYAKSLGIPSYVFINKQIVNILPIWKRNKEADFSDVVDSTKVFEFVEEVREKSKQWCYDFERSQDIVPILKIQLSNLFKLSLDLRRKYDVPDRPRFYNDLSGKALNIILKEDLAFEPLFFAQSLQDELLKYESLKLDLEYKVVYSCSGSVRGITFFSWIDTQFSVVTYLLDSLNNLFDNAYRHFYGKPGEPSDLKGLYYVSSSIAKIYKEMLEWSIRIQSTLVDEEFVYLRDLIAKFVIKPSQELWEYGESTAPAIEDGIRIFKTTGEKVDIKAQLTLTANPDLMNSFTGELNRLRGIYL